MLIFNLVKSLFLPQLNFYIIGGILLMALGVLGMVFLLGLPLFISGFFLFWYGIYRQFRQRGELMKKIVAWTGFFELPRPIRWQLNRYFLSLLFFFILLLGSIFYFLR